MSGVFEVGGLIEGQAEEEGAVGDGKWSEVLFVMRGLTNKETRVILNAR